MSPLIQVEDLTYVYTPTSKPALCNVSLNIEPGEFIALVGANGSGKTTLARHFNAILTPSRGRVLVDGMDTRQPSNHVPIRSQVGMVFQVPEDQMVATLVEEEVAFGLENLGVPPAEIRTRVEAALHTVGMAEYAQHAVHQLSAGQMQRVAVAALLAMRPGVIVFDEVTAMLDPQGRQTMLDMMERLHREGLTVITITHFMEEAAYAQRVLVLHEGEIALDGTPEQVFAQPATLRKLHLDLPPAAAIAEALRAHIPALPHNILRLDDLTRSLVQQEDVKARLQGARQSTPQPYSANAAAAAIEVHNLFHTYMEGTPLVQHALEDVSMRVECGSAHALIGATGSGKSTLLQHLNGLLRPQRGSLHVAGFDLGSKECDLRALRRNVGLVFQIPEMYFFEQYVGDEIAYGVRRTGETQRSVIRSKVQRAMQTVGLDFETFKDRFTFTLSSGERRKVALAATLAIEPHILLLDEPAAGLDPLARQDLLEKLAEFRKHGVTLLIASHQMEDLAALVSQVTALQDGKVALFGSTAETFSRVEALEAAGLRAPLAARLAARLRQQGWRLTDGIVDSRTLLQALQAGGE